MPMRDPEKPGRAAYSGNLFLPKYQRIIQGLYNKASKQDEQAGIEVQTIPTIDDLNRLDLRGNVKEEHN